LHQSLEVLKNELKTELSLLQNAKDKRSLTKEEEVILKNLGKRIDSIEGDLDKKFQGMKKDVSNRETDSRPKA
jgi:hypothetical protein